MLSSIFSPVSCGVFFLLALVHESVEFSSGFRWLKRSGTLRCGEMERVFLRVCAFFEEANSIRHKNAHKIATEKMAMNLFIMLSSSMVLDMGWDIAYLINSDES